MSVQVHGVTENRRVAFLTMQDTAGWSIDADLAFEPLAELGWHAEWLPWQQPGVDWAQFDAVYTAATWDYPELPQQFLEVLEAIDRSSALLVNPLELARWNIPKTYLRDLDQAGVRIVPSSFHDRYSDDVLLPAFDRFVSEQIIVKPVIGANAQDTFLLSKDDFEDRLEQLRRTFAERPFIVQPYLSNVAEEGEYSLFWIGDAFSHAILKVPKQSDFRVQEEHGASILATELTGELLESAHRALSVVPGDPLYARCDFVRNADGELCVMELELIEPSLYLRMHESAPTRFAAAFDAYIRR